MDERTLAALRGSIAKWRAIVYEGAFDEGVVNCPLCELFARLSSPCTGCPVSEKSGKSSCAGTPYERWSDAATKGPGGSWRVGSAESLDAALAELAFLESLLPAEPASLHDSPDASRGDSP